MEREHNPNGLPILSAGERHMARQKTTKHKGITRVDRDAGRHPDGRRITATHGFFVRVTWKGETFRKFFSDSVYGDRLGALDAARNWRDTKEIEVGKPRTERMVVGTPHSNTGIVGIRKIVSGPWGHEAYEANWVNEDGTIGRTSYSITKNGKRKALKLAIEARNRGESERRLTKFTGRVRRRSQPRTPATPSQPPQPEQESDASEWPPHVDRARLEPPSFSLPSFSASRLHLEDYEG
jgi:hypothetical protein